MKARTHRPPGSRLAPLTLTLQLLLCQTMIAADPTSTSGPADMPPVPSFSIPATAAEWNTQRVQTRETLRGLLGRLPERPAVPSVQTRSREDRGDYWLERFEFANGAGATVPGVLLLPKQPAGKVPAILYCHWHGGEYSKGKIELFETNHTPVQPGPTLARRGYAVLAIDAYCFGERNGVGPAGGKDRDGAGELTASKFNLWLGRSLWGMILRDDLMALDYLASRPEVDPHRIGATGMSMGATRTWWLMALDERIRAGVAVACMTRYQDLIRHDGMKYHGIYYYVPGMLNHFDTEAVVSLVAPRPLLLMNGDQDDGSPVEGIRAIEGVARRAYDLSSAGDRLESRIYPGVGHEYLPDMWQRTLGWFDHHLKTP